MNGENHTATLYKIAALFLSHTDKSFSELLSQAFESLSEKAGIHRASVWRNIAKPSGRYAAEIYRWDKTAGMTSPTIGLDDVSFDKYAPDWNELFASGNPVNGIVEKMPKLESDLMKAFGIVSVFAAPLFFDGLFWGFIIFEDRKIQRRFADSIANLLLEAGSLIANAVVRNEMVQETVHLNREFALNLEQQAVMFEIAKSFISDEEPIKRVNEAITSLGYYLNASMVLLFRVHIDDQTSELENIWAANEQLFKPVSFSVYDFAKRYFPFELNEPTPTIPVISCSDIADSDDESLTSLLEADVNAFLSSPIYIDGRLWGVISVENHRKREWSNNEKEIVSAFAGNISGVITKDIYNKRLQEAVQRADAASRAKGDFLSNMSHEMRTPLNAIIGMTTIGKKATELERKNYVLDRIGDASEHLLSVINDILDMSKIEANKLELSPVEFEFESMMRKVVTVLKFKMDEKRQHFRLSIDEKIPKNVIADDHRLAQVINNLISNAIKFTPEDGDISLSAELMKSDGKSCTLKIAVKDSGIGVTAEQKSKLFAAFTQAESGITRQFGGTGLGLAISKKIVELMDGEIHIESEYGKGAAFIFTINVLINERSAFTDDSSDDGSDVNSNEEKITTFPGKTILLAEDMEINREIITSLLEGTGLTIDEAENGEEALRKVANSPNKYDLVFMDVQMPKMDGHEAARQIRLLPSDYAKELPIIAMTANVFKEDVENCLESGMNGHIAKPIDLDEVFAALRKYIKS